jgi:hypothetical protein
MSAAQPLPGRLPSAGISGAPEPMAAAGPGERRLVGAHHCYGCGYEPCLMAKYDGTCSDAETLESAPGPTAQGAAPKCW